ncbi:protein rep [Brevibacillus sp. DP1.3A]|uniref:protein rep n=1 Tax=Brevibacillus sp. DP1.3A TaxID=2738867 RepID=UPI00156B8E2D|nr:protein rep [Brevibacillus sp. DP1.3A]UED78116.1 protein rep [Brevibacillus sp. DP1.3A]
MESTQQVTSQKIGGLGVSPSIGECLHDPVPYRQESGELTGSSRLPLFDQGKKTVRAFAEGVEVLGRSPLGKDYEFAVTPDKNYDKFVLQSVAKKALPGERVAICFRNRRCKNSEVEVWKHRSSEKAFYGNLAVCGSVWQCPVCAAKISELRKKELRCAVDGHLKTGKLAMLTLTFSHQKKDRLKETLAKFSEAVDRFRSGKRYARIMKKIGLIGTIRSFEITYGTNGWHPHIHILMFFTHEIDMEEVEDELMELWLLALSSTGLSANRKYGLTLQDAEKASDYVSKWGVEHEMTKSHSKKGKQGGMTPFDFLREFLSTGNKAMLGLFQEYAEAVKRKRQLSWSKGLKKMFLLEEKTDEQLANEKTEEAELIGIIEDEVWKWIVRTEKRRQFLSLVEKHGDVELAFDILLEDYPDGDDG